MAHQLLQTLLDRATRPEYFIDLDADGIDT